ncbi:hypothetical protein [Methylobacterium radiotolerans]|uniref:hypothetical protein n=1 Tax=Methylobacterium radiotolerans TaxID=31998 RepID=UPI000D5DA09F|nr:MULTISPECIES: hypothetical protein [Methylobacterium]MDE3749385.1 hypothetical protein [Methylobacterium radiotolerans]PVY97942.1 hypothetical protein C7388_112196 [Methylobacterium organophilum]
MSAFDWKTDPTENGQVDAAVPALPGTSARLLPDAARGIMAGVAMLMGDQGGALVAEGAGDVYLVQTLSGLRPAPGVMIGFWANRDNVAEPALAVDGYGPAPLLAADGGELAPGAMRKGEFQLVVWDEAVATGAPSWRKINPSPTDLGVLNAGTVLRTLAALLPTSPPPGKGQPWFNGVSIAFTTEA